VRRIKGRKPWRGEREREREKRKRHKSTHAHSRKEGREGKHPRIRAHVKEDRRDSRETLGAI